MKKPRISLLVTVGVVAGAVAGFFYWLSKGIEPTRPGPSIYVRYIGPMRLGPILGDLHRRGVVRDPNAMRMYAWLQRKESTITTGTYLVRPGMDAQEILRALREPIKQMVRIPETNWARRTANVLQAHDVTQASDYLAEVRDPQAYQSEVIFPLPKDTLEGYLYPDTYDFPPLLGARQVIERQLKNFERRVVVGLSNPPNLHRILTIASLVEMEVKYDDERPKVASVIYNRLKKNMPLQIDAAINYGLGKWRPLKASEYKTVDSPYNLYTHTGLPPTPICSPTVKSIEAALHPATTDSLYYVALPDGTTVFSHDIAGHLKNIEKRKHLLRLQAQGRLVAPQ